MIRQVYRENVNANVCDSSYCMQVAGTITIRMQVTNACGPNSSCMKGWTWLF